MAEAYKTKSKHQQNRQVCRQFKKVSLVMFTFLRFYIDHLIDYMFGFYYNSRVAPIPTPQQPDIILQSATSLARKIRKRELTSEKVVQAFIDRTKQVNPILNAVVDNCFDQALKEAKQIDKDIATGQILDVDFQTKPFLGVPFTTKESTAVDGLSHTFGLKARAKKKSNYDAEVVAKMKKAGGIVMGVTNVPQLNLWIETSNPLFGVTNNPYNITRNVGGSSGGESSIIAACGSPIGIGSDIGGSIRIPAFMCGIFGHKPTCDLISTNGLTFRTGKEKGTMVVAGPMTKYAEDITPLMKVLLGDKQDKLKLDENVDVKQLNVFYVDDPHDPFISPSRDEMKRIFQKVVAHFRETQAEQPKQIDVPELKYGGKLWRYWMSQEPGADFNRDITNREYQVGAWTEIWKFLTGRSDFSGAVIFGLINGMLPAEKEQWAKEMTDLLHKKLMDYLGKNGVLLYPSAPWPASYHHTAFLRPWNFNMFCIWNALKFPVTQVPLGLSVDGLPLGIQVVTAPFNDHLAIAVAKELEKTFGGYVPPFKVDK